MRARVGLLLIFAAFTQALRYQPPPEDTPGFADLAQEDFPNLQQDDNVQMEQDDYPTIQDVYNFLEMQQDGEEGELQQDDEGEMEQGDDDDDENLAFLQRSIEDEIFEMDDRMAFANQDDGDMVHEKELEGLLQQDNEDEGMVFATQDDEDTNQPSLNREELVLAAQDGDEEEGGGTAVAQWNNRWDGPLRVVCPAGQGLYRVYSIHNNGRQDRLFRWYCKRVYSTALIRRELRPIEARLRRNYLMRRCQLRGNRCRLHQLYRNYINNLRRIRHHYYNRLYLQRYGCSWKKINNYDQVMNYRCPTNSYLTGLYSRHDNRKEDREWYALCCRTRRVCMNRCRWSGFINNWDATMNYATSGIMTGLYSYHNNHKQDRRWRVYYCYSRKC